MSCIYKYKGKDYTKEEFYSLVSSSNFIQQEQARKFAELQERLNNKEFLKGAKNAFESSKGLQEWGTQEQYNDYIARVSLGIVKNPSSGKYNYESQIKDIVYHGSPNAKLINESKDFKFKINSDDVGITNGVYFSQNINLPNSYQEGTYINTDTTNKGIIPALVNITNPKYYNDVVDISVISDNNLQELRNENFDGAYTDMLSDDNLNSIQQDYNTEIVVFNPEQIHILGSKQDIEGFKKYVNKNNPIQQTITDLFNDLEIKKC